jgi:hypothetical protein
MMERDDLKKVLEQKRIGGKLLHPDAINEVEKYLELKEKIQPLASEYQWEKLYGRDLSTVIFKINSHLMPQKEAYRYWKEYLPISALLKYLEVTSNVFVAPMD